MFSWIKNHFFSFAVSLIFFLGILTIFLSGQYLNNFHRSEGWWSVYFNDPKGSNLDFTIENHNAKTDFHWEAFREKEKINEGDLTISQNQSEQVKISSVDFYEKKIRIVVTQNTAQEEIFKNFN